MNNIGDLYEAVKEGAVQRIRPKMMTVCAILFGLLPIMWSPALEAGADVMKRIATPMIGGVITSAILNLVLYPVIYVIWRRRELPSGGLVESGTAVTTSQRRAITFKGLLRFLIVALIAAALFAGGFAGWNWWSSRPQSTAQNQGQPIPPPPVAPLTLCFLCALH